MTNLILIVRSNDLIHDFILFLVYSLQGRRPTMEDRFVITESLPPVIDKVSPKFRESNSFSEIQRRQSIKIYGVFDGHGGEV